jgi:1-acyl-sn-glycerol-3-phosphate acyltransferase
MRLLVNLLRRFLYSFLVRAYFQRVTVLHRERLPQNGPVLFLALHRNGAVDGFVYHQTLCRPTFMISTQLQRGLLGQLLFPGIAVTRTKDEGDRAGNAEALQECVNLLRTGGWLCVFPEGTSSLGPRHLPFKTGAAWLINEYLRSGGPPLHVVPVGIHYECPWAFRAKVEVVIGERISVVLPTTLGERAQLKEMKRRIEEGLGAVGVNVASEEYQDQVQRLAYVSTLATPRTYFRSLKAVEKEIPAPILQEWEGLQRGLRESRMLCHQGVPLVPMGPTIVYALALLVLAPVVAAAVLLNLPPFVAGWVAGKKLPDDRNVISLWKVLVGIPTFILWIGLITAVSLFAGKIAWLAAYGAITWAGVHLYYRVKKLAVAVHNGLVYPKLKPLMLRFRETVLQNLPEKEATPDDLNVRPHPGPLPQERENHRRSSVSTGAPFFGLLPHEIFFGLFLLVMTVRVIAVEGVFGPDSLLYMGFIAVNFVAVWFCRARNTALSWRIGMLFYPVAMNLIFTNMKVSVPRIHPGKLDWLLQRADSYFVGVNLSVRLQTLVHPVLTELFSFCYSLFFIYLLFSLIYYFFTSEVQVLRRFVIGLFTIYGIGFLGYSFVPAAGPCHAMADQFTVPLHGWWITRLNDRLVSIGSNGVDVFPSLHCAVSAFFLFFDRRHRPWRFRLYLVPCVGLWMSTIYLRYHYAVDLVCGFALAGFALWLSNRYPLSTNAQSEESKS